MSSACAAIIIKEFNERERESVCVRERERENEREAERRVSQTGRQTEKERHTGN